MLLGAIVSRWNSLEPTTGVDLRFESRSCKVGRSSNERALLGMGVEVFHRCLCRVSPVEPQCSRPVEKRIRKGRPDPEGSLPNCPTIARELGFIGCRSLYSKLQIIYFR